MKTSLPRPLSDRVIVKVLDSKDNESAGGLVLPNSASKFKMAEVKAVGRGIVTAGGSIIEPEVRAGDIVYITSGGDDLTVDKEKYLLIPERLIVAVVRSEGPTSAKRLLSE